MEIQNNPDSNLGQKSWRPLQEKEEIILQWQQSGKAERFSVRKMELLTIAWLAGANK